MIPPCQARYMYFNAANRCTEFQILKDLLCCDDDDLCEYIGIDHPPGKATASYGVDDTTLEMIIKLANQGYTVNQIACKAGISKAKAFNILRYQHRIGNVSQILWPERSKARAADLPIVRTYFFRNGRPIRHG